MKEIKIEKGKADCSFFQPIYWSSIADKSAICMGINMKTKQEILQQIKNGLIVSIQALKDEPLHSSYIMSKMAVAAEQGGAAGIRANSIEDIYAIKQVTDIPLIGIIKAEYPDSEVYITPTMIEVDQLIQCGCEIIALDATKRIRPNQISLEKFFQEVRNKYPDQLFMADTSCLEEGLEAKKLGFDIIATTLAGYTDYTKGRNLPDFELLELYTQQLDLPIIAEGGIWDTKQLSMVLNYNVWSVVIGSAITRPKLITERFVHTMKTKQ